ncbi:MAG: hypothetical protein ABH835_02460 [Patescibacteria group bacterium]|nr:hypothetical protein [Patescibacteria group bacterium]
MNERRIIKEPTTQPDQEKAEFPSMPVEFKTKKGKNFGFLVAYVPEWGRAVVNAPLEEDADKGTDQAVSFKHHEIPIENLILDEEQQAEIDEWLAKRVASVDK